MIDLSQLSLADIENLVAAEKARRRDAALAKCQQIAARHGFTLAELIGARVHAKRAYSRKPGRTQEIIELLGKGVPPSEIAEQVGFKNSSPVYMAAMRNGFVRVGKNQFVRTA